MSRFFNQFELQPEPVAELDDDEFAQPEWGGHPHAVLPGRSNQIATLFRTEAATLVLCCVDAYPIGIESSLRLLTSKTERHRHSGPLDLGFEGGAGTLPLSVRLGASRRSCRCLPLSAPSMCATSTHSHDSSARQTEPAPRWPARSA